MSERGLTLALQRLHDDPGFADAVCSDPEHTLGIYDLDENDRDLLSNACQSKNQGELSQLARNYGIDWQSDHVAGLGALDEQEVSLGKQKMVHPGPDSVIHHTPSVGISDAHAVPGAMTGDGYEGTHPGVVSH